MACDVSPVAMFSSSFLIRSFYEEVPHNTLKPIFPKCHLVLNKDSTRSICPCRVLAVLIDHCIAISFLFIPPSLLSTPPELGAITTCNF